MAQHENSKSWVKATAANVISSGSSVSNLRQVLAELQKKEIVEDAGPDPRSKLMKGSAEVESLDSRIAEVKEAVKKIGDQFLRIQYEYRVKWGQLKVCEQRLEQRSKRPPSEVFKDHLSEALDHERKVLKDSRAELQVHAKDAMSAQQDLEQVFLFMNRDVAHKRTPSAAKPLQKSASLPQLAKSAGHMEKFTVQEDPALKALKAPELIKLAHEREGRAEKIVKTSTEVILRVGQLCAQAQSKVATSMEKRCLEVGELKKILFEHLQEAIQIVADADRVLSRMQMQDRVRQETAAAMGEPPPPPNPAKENKMKSAEKFLEDVKAAKMKLEEDYRCKIQSLQIEQSCKSLIAARVDARAPEHRPSRVPDSKSGKPKGKSLGDTSTSMPASPSGTSLPPASPSAASLSPKAAKT